MFFTFNQNNSGGVMRQSDEYGDYVIIEAADAEDANYFAQKKAEIYFNGVSSGADCSCCGDRWPQQWSNECGSKVPFLSYGEPDDEENFSFEEHLKEFFTMRTYFPSGNKCITVHIYRLDGSHEYWIVKKDNNEIVFSKGCL